MRRPEIVLEDGGPAGEIVVVGESYELMVERECPELRNRSPGGRQVARNQLSEDAGANRQAVGDADAHAFCQRQSFVGSLDALLAIAVKPRHVRLQRDSPDPGNCRDVVASTRRDQRRGDVGRFGELPSPDEIVSDRQGDAGAQVRIIAAGEKILCSIDPASQGRMVQVAPDQGGDEAGDGVRSLQLRQVFSGSREKAVEDADPWIELLEITPIVERAVNG